MSDGLVDVLCSDAVLSFLTAADLLRLECVNRRFRALSSSDEGARAWGRSTRPADRPTLMHLALWRKLANTAASACAFDPVARNLIRAHWPAAAGVGCDRLRTSLLDLSPPRADVPLPVTYQAAALAHESALHGAAAFFSKAGAWAVLDDQPAHALDLAASGGDATVEEGFFQLAASFGQGVDVQGLRAAVGWLAFDLQAHLIAEWHAAEAADAITPAAVAAAAPSALFERCLAPLLGSCMAYTALSPAQRRAVDVMLGAAPALPARPIAHFKLCLLSALHRGLPPGQCCHGDCAAVAAWDVLARPGHNMLALIVERLVVPRLGYKRCLGLLVAALGDAAAAAAAGVTPRTAVASERPASLAGDEVNYESLLNSLLATVLLRGKGLPISLSVLYSAVGSRAGIPGLSCAALPGHVVVRCDGNKTGPYAKSFGITRHADAAGGAGAGAESDDADASDEEGDDASSDDDGDDGDAAPVSARGTRQPLILLDAFRGGMFLQSMEGPIMPRDMGIPAAASLWVRSLYNMRAGMIRHCVTTDHDAHIPATAWLLLSIFLGAELASRASPANMQLSRGAAALRASLGLAAFGGQSAPQAAGRSRRSSTRGAAMAPTEAPALQAALVTLLRSLSTESPSLASHLLALRSDGALPPAEDTARLRIQPWMHALIAAAHLRGGMSSMSHMGGGMSSSSMSHMGGASGGLSSFGSGFSSISDSSTFGALTPAMLNAHNLSLRILEVIRSDSRLLRLAPALEEVADSERQGFGAAAADAASGSSCWSAAAAPAGPGFPTFGGEGSGDSAAAAISSALPPRAPDAPAAGAVSATAALPAFPAWQEAARLHPGHIQHKRAAVAVYLLFRFVHGLDPFPSAAGAPSSAATSALGKPCQWVPYPDARWPASGPAFAASAVGGAGSASASALPSTAAGLTAAGSSSAAGDAAAAAPAESDALSLALRGIRAVLDGVYDHDIEKPFGLWYAALYGEPPKSSAVKLGQRPPGSSALVWTFTDYDVGTTGWPRGRFGGLGLVLAEEELRVHSMCGGLVDERKCVDWPQWPGTGGSGISVSGSLSTADSDAAGPGAAAPDGSAAASSASALAQQQSEPLRLGQVITLRPHALSTTHGRWTWNLSSPLLPPDAGSRPHSDSLILWAAVLGASSSKAAGPSADHSRALFSSVSAAHATAAAASTLCGEVNAAAAAVGSGFGSGSAADMTRSAIVEALRSAARGEPAAAAAGATSADSDASGLVLASLGGSAVLASAVPPYCQFKRPSLMSHGGPLALSAPLVRLLPWPAGEAPAATPAVRSSRVAGAAAPSAADTSHAHRCPCSGGGIADAAAEAAPICAGHSLLLPGGYAGLLPVLDSSHSRCSAPEDGPDTVSAASVAAAGAVAPKLAAAQPAAAASDMARAAPPAGRRIHTTAEASSCLAVYFQSSNTHAHWIGAVLEEDGERESTGAAAGGARQSDSDSDATAAAVAGAGEGIRVGEASAAGAGARPRVRTARLRGFVPTLDAIAAAPRGAPLPKL